MVNPLSKTNNIDIKHLTTWVDDIKTNEKKKVELLAEFSDEFRIFPMISIDGLYAKDVRSLDISCIVKLLKFRADMIFKLSALPVIDGYRKRFLDSSLDIYSSNILYPANVNIYAFNIFCDALSSIACFVEFDPGKAE